MWNGTCTLSHCAREAVDAGGLCRKHRRPTCNARIEVDPRGISQTCVLPAAHDGDHSVMMKRLIPEPGYCHSKCGERSTFIVQVKRINGLWTKGIDFCEPHAHAFAERTSMEARVQPL